MNELRSIAVSRVFVEKDRFSMSRRAREEEDEGEMGEQHIANEALLRACLEGSLAEVQHALRSGASVTATTEWGETGLILACYRDDWDAALPVVQVLLGAGSSVRTAGVWNALHTACALSSAEIVQVLLEADPGALASSVSTDNSPLLRCCDREDQDDVEAAKIATLLLDRGSDVNASVRHGCTPVIIAAASGGPALVTLLLARGADLHAKDEYGDTALMRARGNGLYGREVVPILCKAGADVEAREARNHEKPFFLAVATSGTVVEALAPFLPQPFDAPESFVSDNDPVGSLVWRTKCSRRPWRGEFAREPFNMAYELPRWAHLRNGRRLCVDQSEDDVFGALQCFSSVELWKWASSELPHQHPLSGDTVFHLLCRTDKLTREQKLAVLADLRRHHRNPLTPNYRNELCVELTNDAELKKALQSYMCWQPHRLVMEWFGPFFQQRAFALLLVCKRLKSQHPKRLAGLNRDIRHLLVKYASRVEHIYVPSKVQ
jgi:hypothetical protein